MKLKLNLNIQDQNHIINQTFKKIGNIFAIKSGFIFRKKRVLKLLTINIDEGVDLWIWDTTNAAKFKIN